LAQCTLSENEKKFMRRFLDVTKAQLFFAKGVVFVEGVSEALLIAECARKLECDLSKHGVSVINVQGLAFAPFAKLFQENAIAIPASIISDGDPGEGVYPEVLEKDTVSATAKTLLQMKSGKLDVFLAAKTFEYDLALAGNARRMCEAYKQERPMKGVKMEAALGKATTPKDSAVAFLKHFDPKDKAVLAQVMTLAIAKEPDPFFVPGYLAAAIRHATGVKDATTG
jgi:putative ATP-dependent endonuclease of OLD family